MTDQAPQGQQVPRGGEGGPSSLIPTDTADFQALVQLVLQKIWLVIGLTVIAGLLGAQYVYNAPPPEYQAKSVIEVDKDPSKMLENIKDVSSENLANQEVLNTMLESITASRFLRSLVATNDLTHDTAFVHGMGLTNTAPAEPKVVEHLKRNIEASIRGETRLIDIRVKHRHPEVAERLANSVAEHFVAFQIQKQYAQASQGRQYLMKEASRLKSQLRTSEMALQRFNETNDVASLENRQENAIENLNALSKQLNAARTEAKQLKADYEEAKALEGQPEELLTISSILDTPEVAAAQKRLSKLEEQLASYKQRYGAKHPAMRRLKEQIQGAEQNVKEAAVAAIETVEKQYQTALSRQENLQSAVEQQQEEVLALNKKSIEYNVLERDVETDRALFKSVLGRLKEADVAKGIEKSNLQVVEHASSAHVVDPIRETRTIALSSLAGLGASLGLIFFLNRLDNTVKTVDTAEVAFAVPVLASVPIYDPNRKKRRRGSRHRYGASRTRYGAQRRSESTAEATKQSGETDTSETADSSSQTEGESTSVAEVPSPNVLVSMSDTQSSCAESFRSLRASLGLIGREHETRIQMFTSASPEEGKTFCAANYAVSLAQRGSRILLIDMDLRRATIGSTFHLSKKSLGVTDVLLGKTTLDEAVQKSAQEDLDLLPAGSSVPRPADLLSSEWVSKLITEASEKYDKVVIDTAPVNAVSDTLLLTRYAQVLCLVVRVAKTPIKATRREIKLLNRAEARPTGTILNMMPEKPGYGYYYYYYHSRPYGGKEGYGEVYGEGG